jgi:hypothetical protein
MHSKTGRFLCRSCIYKDGSGQLQDSDLFEQPELPELENLGGCEFVKPRMNMKTGDSK